MHDAVFENVYFIVVRGREAGDENRRGGKLKVRMTAGEEAEAASGFETENYPPSPSLSSPRRPCSICEITIWLIQLFRSFVLKWN